MLTKEEEQIQEWPSIKNRKRAKQFTYRGAYKEYVAEAEDPVDFITYKKILFEHFYKLSRAIIVEKYEWKLPFYGGYLRIAKVERYRKGGEMTGWWYYWYWDTLGNTMHWPKVKLWSFKAAEGRIREYKGKVRGGEDQPCFGEYGLWKHIQELEKDRYAVKYDVVNKRRRKGFKISHAAFLDTIKNEH